MRRGSQGHRRSVDRGTHRPGIELRGVKGPLAPVAALHVAFPISKQGRHTEVVISESETLGMWGSSMRGNREALQTPARDGRVGRSKKAKGRNADMYVCRESDGLVVPRKRANKAGGGARPSQHDG